MQKTERLLAIILLLQARGKMTAQSLADILEVSARTIYRDMDSLSLAHVPVSMDYGPGGGYFLTDGFRPGHAALTRTEALAIVLGGTLGAPYLMPEGDVRQALVKLEAALPEMYRDDVRRVREYILLDTPAWHRSPEAFPYLDRVRAAIWAGKQVDLLYRRSDRLESEWRCVDPLGLVCKSGSWYLVAYCHRRRDFRTFRLSRFLALSERDDPIDSYSNFDLQSYWQESRHRFEELTMPIVLRLCVHPCVWQRMQREGTVISEESDGRIVVEMRLDTLEYAVSYVLSCGPEAEVLEPAELRTAVATAAQEIVVQYA